MSLESTLHPGAAGGRSAADPGGDDREPAPERGALPLRQKIVAAVALALLALVLLLTFRAYLTPAMLFDFATLQICS